MRSKEDKFFWPSFSDLMTSMFFIMLVLYVLTYVMLKNKERELQEKVEDLDRKLKIYTLVEQNLKPLKQDTFLFRYEENYKRFTLAFDVNFEIGQSAIDTGKLKDYTVTSSKIFDVGKQLQIVIDNLAKDKANNASMKNVSYLLIISGYASHLPTGSQWSDYELSYKRAYNLWGYWKDIGIDFEGPSYRDLIDLQISGNGWGGIGRFPYDFPALSSEKRNQRFIIQIVPKIGNTSEE